MIKYELILPNLEKILVLKKMHGLVYLSGCLWLYQKVTSSLLKYKATDFEWYNQIT